MDVCSFFNKLQLIAFLSKLDYPPGREGKCLWALEAQVRCVNSFVQIWNFIWEYVQLLRIIGWYIELSTFVSVERLPVNIHMLNTPEYICVQGVNRGLQILFASHDFSSWSM